MRYGLRRKSVCEPLELRRLLAAVSWDAGGDAVSWNDPVNWSGNLVPTAADDVTIATGSVTVSGANALAKSLVASVPLLVSGQTLDVDGDVTLGADSQLQRGRLIIDGNLTLNNNATLFINIGYSSPVSELIFKGSANRTISGNGTLNSQTDDNTSLLLNDTHDASNNGLQLTIGSGIDLIGMDLAVRTTYAGGRIVNNGDTNLYYSVLGNYEENAVNGQFINNGTLALNESAAFDLINSPGATFTALGGSVSLFGDWDNNGTFIVADGNLLLYGTFTRADIGTLQQTGAGAVYIMGTLDNTGQTLALDNTTGTWGLYGMLLGGTLANVGDNQLIPFDGTFNAVTVNSPVTVQGGVLHVRNGMTLNSSITLTYGSTTHPTIQFDGNVDQTLGGTGTIISQSDDSVSPIYNNTNSEEVGKQLTIGSGISITGPGLTIYSIVAGGSIVNNGTISATGTANGWTLGNVEGTFTNNGTITGENLLFLTINNLHNNPGHSVSVTNSALYLDGSDWDNNGSMSIVNSDLYLGGVVSVSNLGSVTRSGAGSTHLFGLLLNASQTFTLNSLIRDLYLDVGVVMGGTIAASGGYQVFGAGGLLDGVTLDAPMTIVGGNTVYITGGLTLNNHITLGSAVDDSNAALYFAGAAAQTLGGTGSVSAEGNTISYFLNFTDPASTLTIGSGIHIAGKYLSFQGAPIVNNGTIGVDGGGAWSMGNGYPIENHGSISVGAGAFLSISGLVNASGGTVGVASGATLVLFGDVLQNAGAIDVNGVMILDYTDTSPLATVQGQIASGFAGGAWNGNGIRSSAAAASSGARGLAYAESSALLGPAGGMFAAQTVDGSAVLVRYTASADANADGEVNSLDFNALAGNFNKTSGMNFSKGDFNHDGKVNAIDFGALAKTWGASVAPAPAAAIAPSLFGDRVIRDFDLLAL